MLSSCASRALSMTGKALAIGLQSLWHFVDDQVALGLCLGCVATPSHPEGLAALDLSHTTQASLGFSIPCSSSVWAVGLGCAPFSISPIPGT